MRLRCRDHSGETLWVPLPYAPQATLLGCPCARGRQAFTPPTISLEPLPAITLAPPGLS